MDFLSSLKNLGASALSTIGGGIQSFLTKTGLVKVAGGDIPVGTPGSIPAITQQGTVGKWATPEEMTRQVAFEKQVATQYPSFKPTAQPSPVFQPTQPTYYQPAITTKTTQPITQPYQPTTQPSQPSQPYQPPYIPPQAPSGKVGESSPITSYAPPAQAPSGIAGGRSAFTGTLGGVSGLNILSANAYASSQEEKQKKEIIIPQGASLSGLAKQYGVSVQDLLGANPQITNPNLIRAGASLNVPSATPAPVSVPPTFTKEGAINLAAKQATDEVAQLLRDPNAKITAEQFNQIFERKKQSIYEQAKQQNPALTMDEPMPIPPIENISKPERPNFVKQWETVARQYQLPDQIKQMEDMRTRILSEATAYDGMIKEIKDNPDFPKSLAKRRTDMIENARNVNLKAMELQLNYLVDNYNQRLDMAKYEMGVSEKQYTTEENAKEKERDNVRNQISQFISTGAIAEMSDADLQQIAQAGRYKIESLQAVRKAVKSGNETKMAQAQANLEKTTQAMDIAAQRLELAKAKTTTQSPESATGANYNTRLGQEISNLYSGRYGTKGAREKILSILKSEFPSVDVAKDIYNRVPDNWKPTKKTIGFGVLNYEDL
mgnify:CR=1 FL=1